MVRKELFFLDVLEESRFAKVRTSWWKDSVIYSVVLLNDAASALDDGKRKTKFNYNIYTNSDKQEQMIVETIGMKIINLPIRLPRKWTGRLKMRLRRLVYTIARKQTLAIGGRNGQHGSHQIFH